MIVNAYGRKLQIIREEDCWRVFELGNEGKKRSATDIRIPNGIEYADILGYLGDLLHEHASSRHPEVTLVD